MPHPLLDGHLGRRALLRRAALLGLGGPSVMALLAACTTLIITHTIGSFRAFDPMYVMTNGGPAGATTTLVYYVFQKFPDLMGQASAAATVLLVGVLLITALQFAASRRAESFYS